MLNGWQRSWLGAPLEVQLALPTNRIRNVALDNGMVHFEVKGLFLPAKLIHFSAESPASAELIVSRLPTVATPRFEQRRAAVRDFNARLRQAARPPVITSAIVIANILMFAVMSVVTKEFGRFTPVELTSWGADFGPLTVNGQWWRLLDLRDGKVFRYGISVVNATR